jgi:hypothetical protein
MGPRVVVPKTEAAPTSCKTPPGVSGFRGGSDVVSNHHVIPSDSERAQEPFQENEESPHDGPMIVTGAPRMHRSATAMAWGSSYG